MRTRYFAVFLAFLVSCPIIQTPKQVANVTMPVIIRCLNGDTWYGSGVAIGPNLAVTARHVALSCVEQPFYIGVDGYEATLEAAVVDQDIAVLSLIGNARPWDHTMKVIANSPGVGQKVCYRSGCGDVEARTGGTFYLEAPSKPGFSGSPALDCSGRLVGIAIRTEGEGTLFVGASALNAISEHLTCEPDMLGDWP